MHSKLICFSFIIALFSGCAPKEAYNELVFVSPNSPIEAWIYEEGYNEKFPWKTKLATRISKQGKLSIEDFQGDEGTSYLVTIMSPGKARYSFRIKEATEGRIYRLWGLSESEPLPKQIALREEMIAIIEGKVNKAGDPKLTGDDVEYFRYGIAHGGIPDWIGVDYQGRQTEEDSEWITGNRLFLDCFRRSTGFGLVKISENSFSKQVVDQSLDFDSINVELIEGDCYAFKTKGRNHTGVFRVVSVGYFTDEKIQIFRAHKRM